MKKLIIGSDHAAFEAKELLKQHLQSQGFEIVDSGTHSSDRCDYPEYATKLCREVLQQKVEGILLCGSGIGVSMVANRYQGIRAALCRSVIDAEMARKHNNANVLCLGGRFNTQDELRAIVKSWLEHSFEEGRHADRINQFNLIGEKL